MCIFNKINGTPKVSSIPFKILKKFFDMSKITTINPVLQRNGEKNSYALYYQGDMKYYKSLG
jgi:hypothetical protein